MFPQSQFMSKTFSSPLQFGATGGFVPNETASPQTAEQSANDPGECKNCGKTLLESVNAIPLAGKLVLGALLFILIRGRR